MKKRALVTGTTGQDGSYLADLLLDKGYEIYGIVRRVTFEDAYHRLSRLRDSFDRLTLHAASLESFGSLFYVVAEVRPHEGYHLAAQSFVSHSFDDGFCMISTNVNGTHFLLSALKDLAPECRLHFGGSSEMFGNAPQSPQNEDTPFNSRSPSDISKVVGLHLTRNCREGYGMFAVIGALFNNESERRGYEFVTRKISGTAAKIKKGMAREHVLGNFGARRDWGYAPECVRAMWTMLQQDAPDDYVIAAAYRTRCASLSRRPSKWSACLGSGTQTLTRGSTGRPRSTSYGVMPARRNGALGGHRICALGRLWRPWSRRIYAA